MGEDRLCNWGEYFHNCLNGVVLTVHTTNNIDLASQEALLFLEKLCL